jgi:hypothetical protein
VQVAAVARVPPERLQLMVAPESWVLSGTSDVPGREGGREGQSLVGRRGEVVELWERLVLVRIGITYIPLSVVTMGL